MSQTNEISSQCDVLIIGGGPAGSTAAAVLAQRGRKVVVIEKDRHPRFHIGESLLPLNLDLFEKLGVAEEVANIGIVKRGAEFTSVEHGKTVTFNFAEALNCRRPYAYQVRRSEFDNLLLNNAKRCGAEVHEEWRVTSVEFRPDGVDAVVVDPAGNKHNVSAAYLIDASGRDTFLSNRFGIKRRNPNHGSAALYGHFTGAKRLPGEAEGNISMFWFDHGWFWFIPLLDGTTSVGAVCWPYYLKSRKTTPTQFLHQTIAMSPGLSARLKDAQLTGPATATGNYSYISDRMAGPRYVMVGDAFAFVDPVFSSGVYLAMSSSMMAAEAVDQILNDPARETALQKEFDRKVRRGLKTFSWLIYRMTTPAVRDLFMNARDGLGIRSAVISLLAGDVYGTPAVDRRLAWFRVLYYMRSLRILPRALAGWRQRKIAIRHEPDLAEARE